ncbi:MAG: DUF805 domain-containing protein [Alphaproteobacteria bacterium]|nr:DUF805 domain-containing protein [Alphaproteobacteria bacterium]
MTPISSSQLMKNIIKKSFTLSGREPKESVFIYLTFLLLIESILFFIFKICPIKMGYQIILTFLPILPIPALFVRRLHDHNKNMGFTFLPFILFLLLLPFINFKSFITTEQTEKLISGGILIEIITVLFFIQFFLFFLFLILKGNKNENLYGQPSEYIVKTNKIITTLILIFCLACFLFLIYPFKNEKKVNHANTQTVSTQKTNPPLIEKNNKKTSQIVFQKIKSIPDLKVDIAPKKAQKVVAVKNTSIHEEIKINNILTFLFDISIQTIKNEKEISYMQQTPDELILIKAQNGDVLFILKDQSLQLLLKKQHIKCQKELCLFKADEYLNKAFQRY